MKTITATNLRSDLFSHLEDVTKYNIPLLVAYKHGNAVILSEFEYQNMLQTIQVLSHYPKVEELICAKDTPLDHFHDTLPEG